MDREDRDTGQGQDILNIPFIDDDNNGEDYEDKKVRRKEWMTRPHDELSTIQQTTQKLSFT